MNNDRMAFWVMKELNGLCHVYNDTIRNCIEEVSYKKGITLSEEDKQVILEKVINALNSIGKGE